MALQCCNCFKTVLKIEFLHTVHDLWDSRIYFFYDFRYIKNAYFLDLNYKTIW